MTDKKSNDRRRKLLKSIAAGSGAVVAGISLPESWSKPVINAVMLPAHAKTSDPETPDPETPDPETPDQGCCLSAESYCASLGVDGYIEIDVETDGTITVGVYVDGEQTMTDTILCTGGTFTASNTFHTVSGTVGCAATSISITASIFGEEATTHIATIGSCVT